MYTFYDAKILCHIFCWLIDFDDNLQLGELAILLWYIWQILFAKFNSLKVVYCI